MQRQLPGSAAFTFPDQQHSVIVVEVVGVEADHLADAHAGDRQQRDQGLIGDHPQRKPQRGSGGDQRGDFGVGVEKRVGAVGFPRQHISGWNLVRLIEDVQVAGEPPHDGESMRPPQRAGVLR
jgi:hypothetical protein